MVRATLGLLLAAMLPWAGATYAADTTSGAALYRKYCASCHGLAGQGDGPVGALLSTPPTDLTKLRSTESELMRQIDGRSVIRAHGTSQMPVWGEVFEESLIGEPHRRRTTLLKLEALADYVRSLHKR